MATCDTISVQESELRLFVEEHRQRWVSDELNNRPLLRLDSMSSDQVVCLTIRDSDQNPLGFACLFKGDQIIVSQAPDRAIDELAKYLVLNRCEVPGIFAPEAAGVTLAEYLSAAGRGKYELVKRVLHWELVDLTPCLPVGGQIRPASAQDADMLIGMHYAMQEELNTLRPYDPKQLVISGIDRGEIFVWDTPDQPTVCTGIATLVAGSMTYGAVDGIYTKPDFRGCGYATNLVWHLARDILKKRPAVFLSSDEKGDASFHVYEKLGFKVKTTMANLRA